MSSVSGEEKSNISQDLEKDNDTNTQNGAIDAEATTPTSTSSPLIEQDGGTRAWLQIGGSFLVFGNIWGFVFAFGSFQSYYLITYLPEESASTISWIGTVSTFLLIMTGIVSGPLFDLGYFRAMLIAGAMLATGSVFLMSACKTYWQLMLTQGVLMGLFNGLLYLPGLALVSRAFTRHKAMAMGITTCGAPTGGIVYTLAFEQLISRYSFGWTVRIMGFIMLGSYLVAFPLLLFNARNLGDLATANTRRKLLDRRALTDLPFWSYASSNFLVFCGYMVPFVFVPSYGQLVLGLSRSKSLYIAIISQATSIAGRLIVGYTAARIGVLIPWITCALCSGVFCVAWLGARTEASFIAIAALYGFFSGALIPLPPSVFPTVCPDPKVYGARLGMAQAITSIGSLIGPPIAAALSSATSTAGGQDYLGLQLFGGVVMIAAGLNLVGLWVLLARRRDGGSKLI